MDQKGAGKPQLADAFSRPGRRGGRWDQSETRAPMVKRRPIMSNRNGLVPDPL